MSNVNTVKKVNQQIVEALMYASRADISFKSQGQTKKEQEK